MGCSGDKRVRVSEVTLGNWQQDDIKRYANDYQCQRDYVRQTWFCRTGLALNISQHGQNLSLWRQPPYTGLDALRAIRIEIA